MDIEEARIIIDILKTGSKFYKAPGFEDYEEGIEGVFIEYQSQSDNFLIKRYERADWAMHDYGYDKKIIVEESRLLEMFTGTYFVDFCWQCLIEPNNYVFDFEKPKKTKKTRSQKILERMDTRDYNSLRCSFCKSKNVEPTSYSTSVNIGGANRYVNLDVKCLDCGKDSSYSWDD